MVDGLNEKVCEKDCAGDCALKNPETTETKPVEIPPMTSGYVVGIKDTGEFVFEVLGESPGLVQLLGLHKYAEHRLEVAKDINQGYGTPLLAQQLSQVLSMMKVILNMLTEDKKQTMGGIIRP
jgi:hypothetical protein